MAGHAAEIGTNGNRNDVWYSADGEHWQKLQLTPWNSRHACAIQVHDDALFLAAGNAVTISAELIELGKRDFTHRVEAVWRRGRCGDWIALPLGGCDTEIALFERAWTSCFCSVVVAIFLYSKELSMVPI